MAEASTAEEDNDDDEFFDASSEFSGIGSSVLVDDGRAGGSQERFTGAVPTMYPAVAASAPVLTAMAGIVALKRRLICKCFTF